MPDDEKLEAALRALVNQMTLRNTRVEIPGAGGLALRMYMESVEGRKCVHLGNPDNRIEKVWLCLDSREGERLAAYSSRGYPFEAIEDGDMLHHVLEPLAERLIYGSGEYLGMADLLTVRAQAAQTRLAGLRDAAGRIAKAEQAVADAQLAAGWASLLEPEETVGPVV